MTRTALCPPASGWQRNNCQLTAGAWSLVCMVHGGVLSVCVGTRCGHYTVSPDFLLQWLELVTIQSWAPFRAETRQKRRDLQTVPGKVTFDSWCLVYSVQLEQTLAGAPFHNVHNYVFAWSWSLPSPLVTTATGCSAPSCCVHGVLSCPHRHTTPLTLRTTFLASGWKSAYKKGNNRCVQTMNHLKYEFRPDDCVARCCPGCRCCVSFCVYYW